MVGKGGPDLEASTQRFDITAQGRKPHVGFTALDLLDILLSDLKPFSHDPQGQVELAAQLAKHGRLVLFDARADPGQH